MSEAVGASSPIAIGLCLSRPILKVLKDALKPPSVGRFSIALNAFDAYDRHRSGPFPPANRSGPPPSASIQRSIWRTSYRRSRSPFPGEIGATRHFAVRCERLLHCRRQPDPWLGGEVGIGYDHSPSAIRRDDARVAQVFAGRPWGRASGFLLSARVRCRRPAVALLQLIPFARDLHVQRLSIEGGGIGDP
jgi:hypothetical protein